MRIIYLLLKFSLLLASLPSIASPANVILIIGDGMDDQQITIARNYLVGAQGQLTIDNLPIRGISQVLTVDEDTPSKMVYVADSANSATAMATGVITSKGRISTSANTDLDLTTIVELAEHAGLKTGIVTSASITDATPAAFIAHIDKRFCENPEKMVGAKIYGHAFDCKNDTQTNGGLGSIAEQIASSNVDVVLGGGSKHFSPLVEDQSQSVLEYAKSQGFSVLLSKDQLSNTPLNTKLLGLFSPSTLPTRLYGENGRKAEAPERSWLSIFTHYIGNTELPPPMRCEDNPKFTGIPSLKQMTETALTHLRNDKGFFLMIESASIDKASHQRDPCGSIGEVAQLNDALDSALAFAKRQPNTLILVTADHGHAAQIIPHTSALFEKMNITSPGLIARVMTPEGGLMGINYATNNGFIEEHSGVNVPLYANKAGQGIIPATIQQPDIFTISAKFLKLL